jgi:hypothetical protein
MAPTFLVGPGLGGGTRPAGARGQRHPWWLSANLSEVVNECRRERMVAATERLVDLGVPGASDVAVLEME